MAPAAQADAIGREQADPQLDQAQVLKASTALLKHIKSEATKGSGAGAKNLFAVDEDDAATPLNAEAIWCQITTKKHIVDEKRLKPGKILLPHSLNLADTTSICLITPDPQRGFKNVLENPSFPSALSKQIRVLGITKIKQRYKTFESRRQLHAQHDVFLADDRAITMLPRLLGKVFYETSKRPVPVRLEAPKRKDATGKRNKVSNGDGIGVASPTAFANEIERALTSARVHLSPSVTTAVQVGWSVFPPEHLASNIETVVHGMVDKFVPKGWRNIRAIHIKGPNTAALPIWMADELWVDEEDVIEDQEAAELARQRERPVGGKRKDRALEAEEPEVHEGSKRVKAIEEKKPELDAFTKEMNERREALRQQKRAAKAAADEQEKVTLKQRVAKKA